MAEVYKNGPVEVAFTVYEVMYCYIPAVDMILELVILTNIVA